MDDSTPLPKATDRREPWEPAADCLREAYRRAGLGCLERLPAGQWLADGNARRMLGLPEDEAPLGRGAIFRNVHPDDLSQIREMPPGDAPAGTGVEVRVLGEPERLVHLMGVPTSAEGMIVLLQDLSARVAAERQRAGTIERIAEANRLETLGTLASGIAHEINNPAQYIGDNLVFIGKATAKLLDLASEVEQAAANGGAWTPVRQMLGTLKLDFLRKELPVATRQAIDGIARIGEIVQAIRDFCYPSTSTRTLFDLNNLVELSAAMTKNKWKRVATLDLDLQDTLPLIPGVEGEIMQVLINLIVNAAQAIAELKTLQRGRIVVRTRLSDESVEVDVEDSGIGIASENIDRIFDLFYTTKGPGLGTGQGLAISQAIVARHNGRIRVDPRPSGGTVFRMVLPAMSSEAAY